MSDLSDDPSPSNEAFSIAAPKKTLLAARKAFATMVDIVERVNELLRSNVLNGALADLRQSDGQIEKNLERLTKIALTYEKCLAEANAEIERGQEELEGEIGPDDISNPPSLEALTDLVNAFNTEIDAVSLDDPLAELNIADWDSTLFTKYGQAWQKFEELFDIYELQIPEVDVDEWADYIISGIVGEPENVTD